MPFVIRCVQPDADLAAITAIAAHTEVNPPSEQHVREWLTRRLPDHIQVLLAAMDHSGVVVGYGVAEHGSWLPPGCFYILPAVHPSMRREGAGSRLFDALLAAIDQHSPTLLESRVREGDDHSLRFAQDRGFIIDRHRFQSVLYLESFDEGLFAGLVKRAETEGIRFLSLAEAESLWPDHDVRRQLWEVNYRGVLDTPGSSGVYLSFEDFSRILFGASWFDPRGQILAADGERIIGLAAVGILGPAGSARAHNNITAVDREYRGRGIAQALKLLAIRYARSRGVSQITTENDSQNAPMLAINRKLGYRALPGHYRMLNHLQPERTAQKDALTPWRSKRTASDVA